MSRISLARALYRKSAKVVLVDASLASLDARTSRHVFENAIKGDVAGDRIVILVTYQTAQAAELDHVVVIGDEKVRVLTGADFQ